MKPVYIQKIGILSACAENADELLKAAEAKEAVKQISKTEETVYPKGKLEFTLSVPSSKVRRCSRYTKMAVYSAEQAVKDMRDSRTGTVISTGYGAVESNITFSDSVVKKNPAICSPAIFSSTVPNSCAGQICMIYGFQGAGTVLTGGDPLEYAALLINSKKAERILCGSVEEYNEELAAALGMEGILNPERICEGSVMLLVSESASKDDYCRASEFSCAAFSKYPYLYKLSNTEAKNVITEVFLGISKRPDMVLLQANGSYLDEAEESAVKSVFGSDISVYAPKRLFGETLGCGYLLNTAFGAAILKEKKGACKSVLAAGIDAHGNYMAVLLEV